MKGRLLAGAAGGGATLGQVNISANVPKAMDVFVPAGTAQSDELDYTLHQPVVLQPVVIL